MMILNQKWTLNAPCSANPGGGDYYGEKETASVALKRLTIFTDTYCTGCPVAQECLDSSNDEDRLWTVRGGYLPLRQKFVDAGRPRSVNPGDFIPKILREGKCSNGHIVTSITDVYIRIDKGSRKSQCKQCKTYAYKNRNFTPGIENKAECKNGHDLTLPNALIAAGGGRMRCHECKLHTDRNRAKATRCKRDHEFTDENTRVVTDSKGKTKRICKACDRMGKRRLAARAKIAA